MRGRSIECVGGPVPECLDAADFNDDGHMDITDSIEGLNHVVLAGQGPSNPFPETGPDPTEDNQGCESYGNGSALEDEAATLTVRGTGVDGGNDQFGSIRVFVSSSSTIAAYHGRIEDPTGIIIGVGEPVDISDAASESFFKAASLTGEGIEFGYMFHFLPPGGPGLPAGTDSPALEIPVCVAPGTPAGEHPLHLVYGELTDAATGRAITHELVGGSLEVEMEATGGTLCFDRDDPPPPPRVDVRFELGEGEASPGEEVAIGFEIESNQASQGFSISIDFDEAVLEAVSATRLWETPDGTPFDFEVFELNNDNDDPQDNGLTEGYIVGGAVVTLTDTNAIIPPFQTTPVVEFGFRIRDDAPTGTTEVRFEDGGLSEGGSSVRNQLVSGGQNVTPSLAGSFVFVNGQLKITPDVTTFFVFGRGDINEDQRLDTTDALLTLAYLFDIGAAPQCLDVIDTNDDGRANLTDPLFLMRHVFLGTTPPPPPTIANPGEDPTPDDLPCAHDA